MAEDFMKLLVLYLDKLGYLYDTYPPVCTSSKDVATETQKEILRNGGLFRIVINILILLIEAR
jgi:hypothetical protein